MNDALNIPRGAPDEADKLRKIVDALMQHVERSMDVQGGAYSLFQTASLLDDQVRQRTSELETALNSLEKVNKELVRTKSDAETARIRLVEAVESISEGFALYDDEDRLVLCNRKFREFWDAHDIQNGESFAQISRAVAHKYAIPADITDKDAWMQERLERHKNPSEAFVMQLNDGRWLKINERHTKDGGIVGIYTDITDIKQEERIRRETELAEQNKLLQNTLDNLRQGVSVFDKNLRLVAWNQRFIELLNLPDGLVEHGMPYARYLRYNMFRGEFGTANDEDFHLRMKRAEDMETFVFEYTRPDGRSIEVQRNPMPAGGFVTTYRDITERLQTEEQLREAKENLEERVRERTDELHVAKEYAEDANLSKTRFLAAASHDLLQPLNASRLFISTLLGRKLDEKNLQLVERADFALKGVESLLGALLEISKLDAGAVPVVISDCELGDIFDRLEQEYGPMAQRKGCELRVVGSQKVVASDPKLLSRILRNFVSNAVRYTDKGRILVGAKIVGNDLKLSVHDTGTGIKETDLKYIFEEFRQLDNATSNEEKGAGLGLAIVKRIAQTLNHDVNVTSKPGEGSCFSVVVPQVASVQKKNTSTTIDNLGEGLKGFSVLVIDNEVDIQLGMQALLENWECKVYTANSQQEATALLCELPTFPDAIIADYHLNDGETGIECLTWLKREYHVNFPAMVITADRTDEIKNLITSHGYALLNKPLKPAKLRAWLSHISQEKNG